MVIKHLKVQYWGDKVINHEFDVELCKLAEKYELKLYGRGFNIVEGCRNLEFYAETYQK